MGAEAPENQQQRDRKKRKDYNLTASRRISASVAIRGLVEILGVCMGGDR